MNKDLYVVLMAGGAGVRFWPYSRNAKPKQFLDVLGTGKTLLQSTYERFLPICPPENIYVVTHEQHTDIVKKQLPQLGEEQILCEPMRKNTAPCIAYASFKIAAKNKDAIIVVSPSDHLILKEDAFLTVISNAVVEASDQKKLITLGITPTRPETGYGYIQFHQENSFIKRVKTFTEKPELSLAKTFVESGDFVWNGGIFIWGVNAIIEAFEKYVPEMAEVFDELIGEGASEDKEALAATYSQCKSISIDYAILEKADNVFVCLGDFSWSDLGSWNSIHEISKQDENQNVIDANALTYDTQNSIIKGSKDKLIIVDGLVGYLVAEFNDVFIVCKKDNEAQFRKYVNDVKAKPNADKFL